MAQVSAWIGAGGIKQVQTFSPPTQSLYTATHASGESIVRGLDKSCTPASGVDTCGMVRMVPATCYTGDADSSGQEDQDTRSHSENTRRPPHGTQNRGDIAVVGHSLGYSAYAGYLA